MKILYAYNKTNRDNEYVGILAELTESLNKGEVILSREEFWNPTAHYDYVVINWPEYLFNWSVNITDQDLESLVQIFNYYKFQNTKLIVVLHDEYSHFGRLNNINKVFDFCYKEADVLIHLGMYSLNKYKKIYPESKHVLVYHPLFRNFNFLLTKENVRDNLKIKDNVFFITSPGAIRSKQEFDMVIDIFNQIKIKNKRLFFPRLAFLPKPYKLASWVDFKSLVYYYLFYFYYRVYKKVFWKHGYMSADELSEFFTASDLIILPRKDILNSGNVILGSQFNRLIVGYGNNNIKELLEELEHISLSVDADQWKKVITEDINEKNTSVLHFAENINTLYSDEIIKKQLSEIFV